MSRRRSKRIESRVECITITDSEDSEAALPRQQAIEDLSDVEDVTPHTLIIENMSLTPIERKEGPRPTSSKRIHDSPDYSPSRRSMKTSRKSKPKIRKSNLKVPRTSKELETPSLDESRSGGPTSSEDDADDDDGTLVANVSTVFSKRPKGSASNLSSADSPSGSSSPSSPSSNSSGKSSSPSSSSGSSSLLSTSSSSSSDTPVIRTPRRVPIQAIDQANRSSKVIDDYFERTSKLSRSSHKLPESRHQQSRGSSSSPEPQSSADATNMISTPLPKKRGRPPKIQGDEQRVTQMEQEAPPPPPPPSRHLMLEDEQDIKHRARRRQLALDKIIGVFKDQISGRVDFVVKWRGLADMERVPFREMGLLFPSKVLDYMFARMQWCK